MVVKMLKWRPWPPLPSKKFHVKLRLHCLHGLPQLIPEKAAEESCMRASSVSTANNFDMNRIFVKVKWQGPRGALRSHLKRSRRNADSTEKAPDDKSIVRWEEEFERTCILTVDKNSCFGPWDVTFVIYQAGAKPKPMTLGSAKMDLAEFASMSVDNNRETKLHVLASNGEERDAIITVSMTFLELRSPEAVSFDWPWLSCINRPILSSEDDYETGDIRENSKITNCVELVKQIDTDGEDRYFKSGQTSDSSWNSFDTDSSDEYEEAGNLKAEQYCVHSYGTLSGVNLVVQGALSHCHKNKHAEDHTPSGCKRSFIEPLTQECDKIATLDHALQCSTLEQGVVQSSVLSLLGWRKRKLSFRSPRRTEEPLLKKAYGENGGDDIDFDRRLSDSPLSPLTMSGCTCGPSLSNGSRCIDFGEENFAIGSWERRVFISRDNQSKLTADVFFATIDQCNERAAGESACAVLVTVIADWLHENPGMMPIKAELDTLIRDGSAEWRKLCDNETYREHFPDKHFDLDTILRAKVRPLVDLPEHSFVGFFQSKGMEDCCDFLQGVMSFDSIWEEVIRTTADGSLKSSIYIVSWNDHFFILKVEQDACYIIDTLGERFFEGCKQAYILRFDKDTILSYCSQSTDENKEGMPNRSTTQAETANIVKSSEKHENGTDEECLDANRECINSNAVYKSKDACKEFIKGFYAGLPLKELEMDLKKGRLGSISLHQRLQIEFHYTGSLSSIKTR